MARTALTVVLPSPFIAACRVRVRVTCRAGGARARFASSARRMLAVRLSRALRACASRELPRSGAPPNGGRGGAAAGAAASGEEGGWELARFLWRRVTRREECRHIAISKRAQSEKSEVAEWLRRLTRIKLEAFAPRAKMLSA